ncbi:MAG: NAD-dependent malic enzyme [Methylotetracoccus sp.]
MIDFNIVPTPGSDRETWILPRLHGQMLLNHPLFNKGTAFSARERAELGLRGLLPPHVDTIEQQLDRAYEAYSHKTSDIERHIFLRALQDENEVLFYRLVGDHIAEMMPIIYTPTVGEACVEFSHIYRHPRGLFITYPERDDIDTILTNLPHGDVEVIVVTDGERILGLGDQGTGGMGIPIGKLGLYTLCGGIHPARTLPVLLDVGTDNPRLLNDPLYMGWRHERVRGAAYDDFIERFVQAVTRRFPNALLQWEDFAQANAGRLLDLYRDRLCTFNDDIQGTAAVATGTVLAAIRATGSDPLAQRIVVLGAGSAGCGISELICSALQQAGLDEAEARSRFYLVDRHGLLREGLTGLLPFQQRFVQPAARFDKWRPPSGEAFGLEHVVDNVRPTVLIGASGVTGAFSGPVVRAMAAHCARPVILPLSNPTSRCEGIPADLLAWTEGRALVATGSPFPDVVSGGRTVRIAQCNNSYVFPGLGLGIAAAGVRRVSDRMFMAAARALADCSPALTDPAGSLLPPLSEIRSVSRRIALAVAREASVTDEDELQARIDQRMWTPHYPRLVISDD